MKRELLKILDSPCCAKDLALRGEEAPGEDVVSGMLSCVSCGQTFPISNSVPRIVPADNYAQTFGLQWNRFRQTQLDSHSRLPISQERFFAQTGWPEDLTGQRILDVGCGAGRFAEIALSTGAEVVAIDYSSAVDACCANLGSHRCVNILQADIYRLPFKPGSFDYVYCFGVLQHTPDVKRAFTSLSAQLRPGGRIAVDVYPKLLLNLFWPKYWLRPLMRRVEPGKLFRWVERAVPILLPVSRVIGHLPVVGRRLRYLIPVANYEGVYALNEQQLEEWSVLDTFDMLSPAHDHPQSPQTLRSWFEQCGFRDIEIFRRGFVIGRGRRPEVPE